MRKIKRWFKDFFNPQDFNNLDMGAITESFNDAQVRGLWLLGCFDEIKRINLDVEKRLLRGTESSLVDLCARRKAYQDILESILAARRQVVAGLQDPRPNPKIQGVNLDRTV